MIGSGNDTTINGKKNQVLGVLAVIGGLVWWVNGENGGDSLGQWVALFGVVLLLLGKFQEWLGR